MRTIALVTLKGGAGKSTLTSNIAVAALRAGERVFILDLDPLQYLVKWSQNRKARDVPAQHVPVASLGGALIELRRKGVTLSLIDIPGADQACLDGAIQAADLCIIPTRPNLFDLWASEATRIRVKGRRKEYAFLLNQCPPAQQSARVERGAKALQEMGVLLAPLVSARVDYQEAVRVGLGVSEFRPHGVAAREMNALWDSLKSRLEESAATGKAAASERAPERREAPSWPFWTGPTWPFWQA
jgi:chromosome partitioning protein